MKNIDVRRLRWNAWNIAHIGREGHEATPEEVEQIVHSVSSISSIRKLQENGRIFVLGTTQSGRILAAVIDHEQEGVWYCVSARTASRKERAFYQQELAKRRQP